MARTIPRLSGLIRSGAVVSVDPGSNPLPDVPAVPAAADLPSSLLQITPTDRPHRPEVTSAAPGFIRVDLIDPNPLGPREIYTPEMILERAEQLRTQGQHDPIHVIPNPDAPGRFIICDGWTRVQACIQHNVLAELKAEVHNLTLREAAWFGFEQNEGRAQHFDIDRAMFTQRMLSAGESYEAVAKRSGISKSMLTFLSAFHNLPEELLLMVRNKPAKFGASAVYQLSRLFEKAGLRTTLNIAQRFSEEDHTYRWLCSEVNLRLHPTGSKPRVGGKTIRFANGIFKQKGDQFDLSIKISEEKRAAFSADLEQLLLRYGEAATKDEDQGHNGASSAEGAPA